jgi:hypothetical protein
MPSNKLGTDWYRQDKSQEERDATTQAVASAKGILDMLLARALARKAEVANTSQADYTSPSWSHLQAHKNGRLEELDYFIKMIDLN